MRKHSLGEVLSADDLGCNFGWYGADHGAMELHDRVVDDGVRMVVTILGLLSDFHRHSVALDFGEPLGKVVLGQLRKLSLIKCHLRVPCQFLLSLLWLFLSQ